MQALVPGNTYDLTVRLAMEGTPTASLTVSLTTFADPLDPLSQQDSATAAHDSNPLSPTLSKLPGFSTVPLSYNGFLRAGLSTALLLDFAPSLTAIAAAARIKVRLHDHPLTNTPFHPVPPAANPPFCSVNSVRSECSYVRMPSSVEFTMQIYSNMTINPYSNVVQLTTEYVPDPGIVLPSVPGWYMASLDMATPQGNLLEQSSALIRVHAAEPLNFHLASAVADANHQNIITVDFEIDPAIPVPAWPTARLYLDFPSVN